jgi:FkbM family methyltransferase
MHAPPPTPRPPRSPLQHLGGHLRDALIRMFPLEMRTAGGLIVRLRNRSEFELYRSIFVQQMYPLDEISERLADVTAPVVFDVGANCGFFTALTLDRWREAQVHAFEPQKNLTSQIEEFASFNQLSDRVRVNWAAVGAENGETEFHVHRNPIGSSIVREKVGARRRRTVRVPLLTLDEYARRHQIARVDVLKLDVEGAELEALRGAAEILKTVRVLFAEFHPPHSQFADGATFLSERGLTCQRPPCENAKADCIFVREMKECAPSRP